MARTTGTPGPQSQIYILKTKEGNIGYIGQGIKVKEERGKGHFAAARKNDQTDGAARLIRQVGLSHLDYYYVLNSYNLDEIYKDFRKTGIPDNEEWGKIDFAEMYYIKQGGGPGHGLATYNTQGGGQKIFRYNTQLVSDTIKQCLKDLQVINNFKEQDFDKIGITGVCKSMGLDKNATRFYHPEVEGTKKALGTFFLDAIEQDFAKPEKLIPIIVKGLANKRVWQVDKLLTQDTIRTAIKKDLNARVKELSDNIEQVWNSRAKQAKIGMSLKIKRSKLKTEVQKHFSDVISNLIFTSAESLQQVLQNIYGTQAKVRKSTKKKESKISLHMALYDAFELSKTIGVKDPNGVKAFKESTGISLVPFTQDNVMLANTAIWGFHRGTIRDGDKNKQYNKKGTSGFNKEQMLQKYFSYRDGVLTESIMTKTWNSLMGLYLSSKLKYSQKDIDNEPMRGYISVQDLFRKDAEG